MEKNSTALIVHIPTCSPSLWFQRLQSTIVPMHFYFWHSNFGQAFSFWENQLHLLSNGCRVGQQECRTALGLGGISQVESFKYWMQNMACHIAQCASSKIPPTTQSLRSINYIVWA